MKKLLVMGCIVIMSMFAGDIVAQNTAKREKQECPNTKLNCKANKKCPQVVEKKTVKMKK